MKNKCKICGKKKTKEERCPRCLDFRGRGDYEKFLTGG
jgi:primosomal protein N'